MTMDRDKINNTKISRLLETLFLALMGLYHIYRLESVTTFRLHWPSWFLPGLEYTMAAVALARLLTGRLRRRETLIAAALSAVYLMVYRSDGYDFLPFLAILTVGLADIDYRKILRTCLVTVGVFYCVAVLGGLLGVITNYVRIKNGLRSSWGICYPTDFASLGLFLLLALWVERRNLPDWLMLCLCAGFTAVTWFIAHSSTSTICGLLFLCMILYRIFEKRVVERRQRLSGLKRGMDLLATIAFPLCALCIFGLMLAYARGTGIGYRANTMLSDRLHYQVDAWKQYGPTPFGTPFVMHGDGFSVFPQPNYTFVDSSYPLIMLRYGWILFLALCLTWAWTARRAIRCGDRRLVLVMIIIAVHSFAEHHFIESHFNILVAMPLAAYAPLAAGEANAERASDRTSSRRGTLAIAIAALLFVTAACALGPAGLSWLKTFLQAKHLGNGEHALRLFCVLLAVLGGVCAVVWSVSRILLTALARAPLRTCRRAALVLLACAVAGGGAWLYGNRAIDAAAAENAAMVEADREALEIAVEAATGRVYAGMLPTIYHRSVEGMSYAAFFEDDLARLRGDTVLMKADSERGTFFDSGCLYVPVSQTHALYTGDRAVVEALAAAGYHPTGYFSSPLEVDLAEAAIRNGLSWDDAAGLRLEDPAQSLEKGPHYNLYAGRYTVSYTLRLPEGSPREGQVCTLGVSRYNGEELLLDKEIDAGQFGEDGTLEISIPFTIDDSRNVGFMARVAAGCGVYIESIRYIKTPNFDIHTFYDSRLRPERVEYYNLKGEPTVAANGYHACEYGYDGWKNINDIKYFGRDDRPALCKSGYAEVRREYNAKRQIIRESYYGTDGLPIALTSRQAINEREYDEAGNAVVQRYYGVDGRPVMTKDGYAELRREFDEDKRIVREAYYGVDGLPVAMSTGQYAVGNEYNDAGDVTVRRFYGEDGALKLRTDGYAEVHWQRNGMHQIVREEFYGTDGALILKSDGQAANEREYDEAGNVTVYRYYGLAGEPIAVKSGYAEMHRAYNDARKVVREAYFGTDGEPIALKAGEYAIENEYDDAGNVSVRRFCGAKGEPILRTDGYAEVHWQYNGMRRIVREEFFGTDGLPIAINTGAAADEREYDSAGNVSVYRYYDTQGKPAVIISGYAELHREYNDRRQVVRESYYGTDGRPMAQPEGHCCLTQEYDDRGNVSEKRYYDGNGHPMVITEGYAEVRRVYDRKRQLIREAYFDESGSPLARAAGHAAIEQEFDGDGQLAVRRYLDADGEPMQRIDGYAEARWTRDENGVRNVSFHDLEGNEIPLDGINLVQDIPDGWSRWYTPQKDDVNRYLAFSSMNLGEKSDGDCYTLQLELEFAGAEASREKGFKTVATGSTDGVWGGLNIWNSKLVNITEAPEDGVYRFTAVVTIGSEQALLSAYNIGFRCDRWAGGRFRLRSVKVERGAGPSEWTPGV